MTSKIKLGKRVVELTSPDKIMFPKPKTTKAQLIEYYQAIAVTMLPYLKDRPLTMQRFPNGVEDEGFYQKEAGSYFPAWVKTCTVKKEGGVVHHVVVNDAATLVYLANQLVVTFHVWLSTTKKLDYPNRLIFDLDPSGKDFNQIRYAALELKDVLEGLGLVPFVMTTGSRGLHVVVPLKAQENFDVVREFAHDLAQYMVDQDPKHLTLEMRKAKRRGRIFVDYLRNGFGATGVAPYSVRPRPGAPVATPVEWSEVNKATLKPDMYTIKNIFKRLAVKGDVWHGMQKYAKSLKGARKKLDKLINQE